MAGSFYLNKMYFLQYDEPLLMLSTENSSKIFLVNLVAMVAMVSPCGLGTV